MRVPTTALAGALTAALLTAATAEGAIVERTYHFTGADLIHNVFVDAGRDTDASMTYFEGARDLRPPEPRPDGAPGHYGYTYGQAGHALFQDTWATFDNHVLNHFYLWGLDGHSVSLWGEYYKPYRWVSGTGPDGWSFHLWDGHPDADEEAHTSSIPYWSCSSLGIVGGEPWACPGGLSVYADPGTLAAMRFSVTMEFDTDDMWWAEPGDANHNLHGGNTPANSLDGGLTMWFSGRIYEVNEPGGCVDTSTYHRYQGNMHALVIPEPASVAIWSLLALGLVGIACRRPSRR